MNRIINSIFAITLLFGMTTILLGQIFMDGDSTDWNGHGWGHNFLEFGIELTPLQTYYLHKDGRSILKRNYVIGVCGMTETPIDDWGVDMTTRGILTVGDVSGISEGKPSMVEEYNLANNYPNPFNSSTIINWQVGATSTSPVHVELSVYNLLGQKVTTLVSEKQKPGIHSIEWDASGMASGVYCYIIKTGEWQDVKKMVLVR